MTSASPSLTNLQSLSGSRFSAQDVPNRVLSRLNGAGAPSAAQVRPTHARARIGSRMGQPPAEPRCADGARSRSSYAPPPDAPIFYVVQVPHAAPGHRTPGLARGHPGGERGKGAGVGFLLTGFAA